MESEREKLKNIKITQIIQSNKNSLEKYWSKKCHLRIQKFNKVNTQKTKKFTLELIFKIYL